MATTHMFTLGPDQHPVRNAFVLITGVPDGQARDIMFALYGRDWAFHYTDQEQWAEMVRKHRMACIRHIEVRPEFDPPMEVRIWEGGEVAL